MESPASSSRISILAAASAVAVAAALVCTLSLVPSIVGSLKAVVERKSIGSSRSIEYRVLVVVRSSPLHSADLTPAECSASVALRLRRSHSNHGRSSYWSLIPSLAAAVVERLGTWN